MPDDPRKVRPSALAALFSLVGLAPRDEPPVDRPLLDQTPARYSPGLLDSVWGTPIGMGAGPTTAPVRDAVWGLPLDGAVAPPPPRSAGFRQDVRLPVEQKVAKR